MREIRSVNKAVWATDIRRAGVTFDPPFTEEELQDGLARLRAVVAREGGADNARIMFEARRDSSLIDVVAIWGGPIAPAAEQHRVWNDADSAFGREREIVRRLKELATKMKGVNRAEIEAVVEWLEQA